MIIITILFNLLSVMFGVAYAADFATRFPTNTPMEVTTPSTNSGKNVGWSRNQVDGTVYLTNSTDKVGIGSANPRSKLDVDGIIYGDLKGFVDINKCGFLNQTETTIAFDGTNTFTLAPVSTTWSYYRLGLKHTITGSKTIVLPGTPVTAGTYYIYIDSTTGALIQSTSAWTLGEGDTKIPVATITFNDSLTPKYHIADERHTALIDRRMHYYLHTTRGTQPISVGALSGYTVNSDVNADKTFAIAQSVVADEDIIHTESALPDPDGTATDYIVFYRTGASTWAWKQSNMPFVYNTATDWIQWDNGGTMTDATGGAGALTRWINSYLLVTNIEGTARFSIINGQNIYTTLASAQQESFSTFSLVGLPVGEYVAVYRLTWSTITSTSQGKCRLAATPQAILVSPTTASGSSIAHNTLAGIQGGFYHWTSDGTNIYPDVTGNIGIGTSVPLGKMEIDVDGIYATVPYSGLLLTNNTATNDLNRTQHSPALVMKSHYWHTTNLADTMAWWSIVNFAQPLGARADLYFYYKNGAGSQTKFPLSFASSGSGVAEFKYGSATNETLTTGMSFHTDFNATNSVDQYSPQLIFRGSGWKSTATAAARTMTVGMVNAPEQSTDEAVGVFKFLYGTSSTSTTEAAELMRMEWGNRLGLKINDKNLTGYVTSIKGNVGIGSTAPRYSLEVDGGIYGQTLQIDTAIYTSGQNVGIATASPRRTLDVYGDFLVDGLIYEATPTADDTAKGVVRTGTAGEDLVYGNVCYLKSDGKYWKAKADASTTMRGVVMALGTYSAGASGTFLVRGHFRDDSLTFTVGSLSTAGSIYVSAGTSGLMTTTQPATSTNRLQILGYATGTSTGYFNPSNDVGKL